MDMNNERDGQGDVPETGRCDDAGAAPAQLARALFFWGAVALVMALALVLLWHLPAPGVAG